MGLPQFAEIFLKKVGIENPSKKEGTSQDPIFEFVPIVLDDLKKQGVWKNALGDRLRVNADKLTMTSYTAGGQDVFYNSAEDILQALTEGQYVLVPGTTRVDQMAIEQGEDQIIDQDLVDQKRVEDVLAQLRRGSKEEVIDLRPKAPVIATIVSASRQVPAKRASKEKNKEKVSGDKSTLGSGGDKGSGERLIIDEIIANSASVQQLVESVQGESGKDTTGVIAELLKKLMEDKALFDSEVTKTKEAGGKNRKKLQELDQRCKELFDRATEAEQALALLLSRSPSGGEAGLQEPSAPASNGEVSQNSENKKSKDQETQSAKLDEVLEKWKVEVQTLIEEIDTPEAYAAFRNGMTDPDRIGKRHFFDFTNIRSEAGIKEKFTPAQLGQIADKERALEDLTQVKFEVLLKADVTHFYNQEQAKIIATASEAELDILTASWPKDLKETATWKNMVDILIGGEKNRINESYDKEVFTLKQNAEIRRRELRLAPVYQTLDAFVKGRPKGREVIVLLQDIVREAYRVFSEKVTKESQGKISEEECEELWREKNREQKLQEFVVNHLHVIESVESVEGEKIFRAIMTDLQEGR